MFGTVLFDPRVPRSRSLPRTIAVNRLHFVSGPAQPLSHVFGNHDGAMLPASATEADREVALALVNVVRQQVNKQFGDAADELLGLRKGADVFGDSRMATRQRAKLGHEMRIRQKAHV